MVLGEPEEDKSGICMNLHENRKLWQDDTFSLRVSEHYNVHAHRHHHYVGAESSYQVSFDAY